MKFFNPEGCKELTKEEFVKLYADSYYLDKPKQVPGISQSSRFVEDEMDKLLKNGIRASKDVARILAWKLGKIIHKESMLQFIYASDWKNAEQLDVTRYGEPFELAKIANYIVDNIERLEKEALSNPQDVLNVLRNENVAGIGTVYLITLLYFLSRGKYPIYDRFAQMALYAIVGNKKPGEAVDYKALPDKNSADFERVMSNEMASYMDSLSLVFGKEYRQNRDIDRALWVYGHLFSKTKEKV